MKNNIMQDDVERRKARRSRRWVRQYNAAMRNVRTITPVADSERGRIGFGVNDESQRGSSDQ